MCAFPAGSTHAIMFAATGVWLLFGRCMASPHRAMSSIFHINSPCVSPPHAWESGGSASNAMRAGGSHAAHLPRRGHSRAAPDARQSRHRRWWRRCARLLLAPLFAATVGVRLAQLRVHMLVCAARAVSAAERNDCRRLLDHSRRLLDHDRPFIHDELCERPDGNLPLVDEDGGRQPAACAAQRTDGIAAPPGRTHACAHAKSAAAGGATRRATGAKSPFHRQDI